MASLLPFAGGYAQFSIGPGGWVTVKAGSSMRIGSDLHIKSTAAGSGYLVDQNPGGDIDITGDVTVDRYLTPDIWHNVASPVSDENSSVYAGTDLVFYYDETLILNDWNFGWVWYYGSTGGPLAPFRGYDVLFYDNPVTVNYFATGTETLNTGPYVFGVTITTSVPGEIPLHMGWNLAGNPYPSPVDWLAASGWDKSDINDAKYIWDGTNDIYTIFIGGGSPIGINGGTRFIPSNQGFWVQAVQNGTIGINNAVRVGNISGTPDFYKGAEDYPLVSLVASSGTIRDEAVVRFIPGTTEGFDRNMDAAKLYSLNPDAPQLSIRHENQVLALNTLPEIVDGLSVTLEFRSAAAGDYTIRLSPRTGLNPSTRLYLRDEAERLTLCLNTDSVYRFYHLPSNDRDRFKLYFNPSQEMLDDTDPENYFTVYSSRNTITILKNTLRDVSAEICVYDIPGKMLYSGLLSNVTVTELQLALPAGYYIVLVRTDENVMISKVFIQRGF